MKTLLPVVLLSLMWICPTFLLADNHDWILGKWQLIYDPDNAPTDYLEFHENGDVISSGPSGTITGIYVVSPGRVKAVLSVGDTDVIFNFIHDRETNQLRVVTGPSGVASIYRKMQTGGPH